MAPTEGRVARPERRWGCRRGTPTAARRHFIFGHIRRLSDSTPAHKALKLAVNARSGDTPHHGWSRPAGRPWTSWISQIVRDTGLTAADLKENGVDPRKMWSPKAGKKSY